MVRAPHDARAHLDTLLSSALTCVKYDPNYADEDGERGERVTRVTRPVCEYFRGLRS